MSMLRKQFLVFDSSKQTCLLFLLLHKLLNNVNVILQYPVSTMMYSSVSQHEMCRLWHQARAGTFRAPRGRCSWCRDRRSQRSNRRSGDRQTCPDPYRMRTMEHTSFDEPIHCVDTHLCTDTVAYCHDSESVSEVSLDSDSRNPSIKRKASKKKVTYQTKAEVISK